MSNGQNAWGKSPSQEDGWFWWLPENDATAHPALFHLRTINEERWLFGPCDGADASQELLRWHLEHVGGWWHRAEIKPPTAPFPTTASAVVT